MKKTLFYIAIFVLFPTLSHASFDYNLKYGAKGNAVIELQEFLTDQGVYSGPISGNFFALTRSAVAKFQLNNGIKPQSGYFGPMTRTKANEILVAQLDESNADEQEQVGKVETPVQDESEIVKLGTQLASLTNEFRKSQAQKEVVTPVVQEKKKGILAINAGDNAVQISLWRSEYTESAITVDAPDTLKIQRNTKECGKLVSNGHDYCNYILVYALPEATENNAPEFEAGASFKFKINAFGQEFNQTVTKNSDKTLLSDE